ARRSIWTRSRTPTWAAARAAIPRAGPISTARGTGPGWSRLRSSAPFARSAGDGAEAGSARRRTTCTSRPPGISASANTAPLPVAARRVAYAPAVATGCFISTGRSLEEAIERVKLAEPLGYESVYVTHIAGRESLTVITAYALATSRIRVGTGVVPIYTRTPATMAQTAATIDELSGGRVTLGLGVSHRPVVEGWHGQTIDRPVAEMREYSSIVRAIL